MQAQAFDIPDRLDRARGMQNAVIAAGETERMKFAEFVLEIVGGEILDRLRIDQRAMRRHERQLERFGLGEKSGRGAGHRPDDIGDAVARLIEKVGRRAAELHGRKHIDTKPPAGVRLDLARPRRQELLVHGRNSRERVMKLERYLRRIGARQPQNGRCRKRRERRCNEYAAGPSHRRLR